MQEEMESREMESREMNIREAVTGKDEFFPLDSFRSQHLYIDPRGAGVNVLLLDALSQLLRQPLSGPILAIDFGDDFYHQALELTQGERVAGCSATLLFPAPGLLGASIFRPLVSLGVASTLREDFDAEGVVISFAGRGVGPVAGGVIMKALEVFVQYAVPRSHGAALILANIQNLVGDKRSLDTLSWLSETCRKQAVPFIMGARSLSLLDVGLPGLSQTLLGNAGCLAVFGPAPGDGGSVPRMSSPGTVRREWFLNLPPEMYRVQVRE